MQGGKRQLSSIDLECTVSDELGSDTVVSVPCKRSKGIACKDETSVMATTKNRQGPILTRLRLHESGCHPWVNALQKHYRHCMRILTQLYAEVKIEIAKFEKLFADKTALAQADTLDVIMIEHIDLQKCLDACEKQNTRSSRRATCAMPCIVFGTLEEESDRHCWTWKEKLVVKDGQAVEKEVWAVSFFIFDTFSAQIEDLFKYVPPFLVFRGSCRVLPNQTMLRSEHTENVVKNLVQTLCDMKLLPHNTDL